MLRSAQSLSLTFGRLSLGLILLVHGLADTFGWFGGPGLERFATQMQARLAIAPEVTTYVVAIGQLLVGGLLLLGTLTRTAALTVLVFQAADIVLGARYATFFVETGGLEFPLVLCALCTLLACHGPGAFRVELLEMYQRFRDWRRRRRDRRLQRQP